MSAGIRSVGTAAVQAQFELIARATAEDAARHLQGVPLRQLVDDLRGEIDRLLVVAGARA